MRAHHHLHLHLDADDRALGAYKVTLGGTNARMQPALPDATPCPIPSHPIAGPPGPTFDLYSTKLSSLSIDTGKEPFLRTGGTSEPSHTRVVHMQLVEACSSMFAAISVCHRPPLFCLSLLSIAPLHHPRSQPIALSRLLAVFSETLAAFRHSLAMTSIPDPTSSPLCHRASASLERPFALCPLAPGPSATERMASSSAVGSQPSSCASLATRYTSRSVRCRPRLSTRLNSARLLLSRMLDRRPVLFVCLSLHLLAVSTPSRGECLVSPPVHGPGLKQTALPIP